MTDIKTQVRQAAEKAYQDWRDDWSGRDASVRFTHIVADAAALAALEGAKAMISGNSQGCNYCGWADSQLHAAIEQFATNTPPHPLLARLTDLEQQQADLTRQIAQLRQEMEQ